MVIIRQPITFAVRLNGWLRLLRLPNLFTVPGDPLAGVAAAVLAGGAMPSVKTMACCSGAALFLYCAGLICNDICDYEHDMICRPSRPLPSRQVDMLSAWAGMLLLGAAGLCMAFWAGIPVLVGALVLLFLVVAYCAISKSFPISAALAMGLCRGASVMLGVLAVGPQSFHRDLPLILAAVASLHVAGLTVISRGEDRRMHHGISVCLPALALAAGGGVLFWRAWGLAPHPLSPWMAGLPAGLLIAVAAAALAGLDLRRNENSRLATRRGVMRLIRAIPPLQFAIMAAVPNLRWAGLVLLALSWSAGRFLGKKFQGS